ncbi:tellurium resistance protein [Streptomyces sp. YIM 98790]|uniref:vWA domain-containing protein n=1 Tax=Streptomyces sp. YIM 98790 TaxID=2689077 RepID=UPI00140826D6|nr:tellurium resistance protein [Streptomyces sp. YIM 98790]
MASRPLHFIWLLDCSASMGVNGKMSSLNFAVREAIPEMRKAADDNPAASLLVRAITFSSTASWHVPTPTPVHGFDWADAHAGGVTALGQALHLAAEEMRMPPMPERALRPVLALVSDGVPTDDWRAGLRALDGTPWGKRAVRIAVAIGDDADKDMLRTFLANPELEPLEARNPRQLVAAIRWASTAAVSAASTPSAGGDGLLTKQLPYMPTQVTPAAGQQPGADVDDVW